MKTQAANSSRVRFAPSPTGFLHIGGVRTAIFNYMFARRYGGAFLLRIEDTDRERSTRENLDVILDAMAWMGLDYDEAPVHQSQRLDRYSEVLHRLKALDCAYDFEDERGKCVKFRMPPDVHGFEDLVLGTIAHEQSDDFVIMKSDGYPTFHLANVVDDHDMHISHVIRGVDHKTNTVKHVAMYRALGWRPPAFAHIPLIHNGKGQKLSKRDGAVSVTEYRKMGYLSDALRNFLALLGWSPGQDREIMPWLEMIACFSLDRVRKSPARFDITKLNHFNQHYIAQMNTTALADKARPFLKQAGLDPQGWPPAKLVSLVGMYQDGLKTLADLPEKAACFFHTEPEYQPKAIRKVLQKDGVADVLRLASTALASLETFDEHQIEACIQALCRRTGMGMGKVAQPLRVAVTGGTVSPGIQQTLHFFGKQESLRRIALALKTISR